MLQNVDNAKLAEFWVKMLMGAVCSRAVTDTIALLTRVQS